MIITLPFLPLRGCNYKLEYIAPKTYSPLNRLVSHLLNWAILIHKTEFRSTSHSLKGHLLFLLFPLLFPTQCMSVTDVFLRIHRGIPIEYSPPLIGFAQTSASGSVALGSSRKNPVCLRRLCQLRLRARKVSCRATRYSIPFSAHQFKCALLTCDPSRLTSSRSYTLPRPHRIISLSRELSNSRTNRRLYFFSRNSRSPILVSALRSLMPYAPRGSR